MCYISLLMSICVACFSLNELVWHLPVVTPASCIVAFVLCAVGIVIEGNQQDKVKDLENKISNLENKIKESKD